MAYLGSDDIKKIITETYKSITIVPADDEELRSYYGLLTGVFYTLYMLVKEDDE